MIYLAFAELLIIAALVWFIARRESEHAKTILELVEHQDGERADLLTRIQRPELVQPRSAPPAQRQPTPEELQRARALAQIGQVVQGAPGGNDSA